MNIEKLRKFYQLAIKNSNKNEASVAALKFLETIDKEELRIHFFKGNPPLSNEQIQEHVNKAYTQGLQEGYTRATREAEIQKVRQQRVNNGTAGTILFHN
tara:strand:+ start:476 stop:775 length:300 start_codon:yes stop_codon:yes gene_type:complete